MAFRVQIRRDPFGKWIVNNPVLLSGEFGYETDTSYMKIGDGATPWNYLPYWRGDTGVTGSAGPTGATGGVILPYLVYTALLTQSGDDNSNVFVSSGLLTIGVTYTIDEIISGNPDWTNVGAPNNEVGTKFTATGTIPNSWGEDATLYYSAAVPVATVLENTIGNIWWSYNGVNQFEAKSNDLFTEDKTILFIQGSNDGDTSSASILNNLYHIDSDTINCIVSLGGNLNKTSIEIRVYN
jgi:hypothetical protein